MKKLLLHKVEEISFALILLLSVSGITISLGQNPKSTGGINHKYALQNLEMGIQSENQGVRKSAIYLAGKHKLIEIEDALIKQLSVESNSNIKVLIGLALFRMNSEKGMKELYALVSSDKNSRVRKMSYAIYNAYHNNKLHTRNEIRK